MKINEIFFSIEGEGKNAGLPTIFIRTTGCNLRCSYCDTKYAYFDGRKMELEEILEKIKKWNCKRICITGGEPLLQDDLLPLLDMLLHEKYKIKIETNGSIDISEIAGKEIMISLDIKCPSSGMHEKMLMENIFLLRNNDELKFVIGDREDYEYAKEVVKKYLPKCEVVMQPIWGKAKRLADWILEDEHDARLSLQIHKILWGNKKGV